MTEVISKDALIDQIEALTVGDGELTQTDVNYLMNYLIAKGDMTGTPRDLIQIRRGNAANIPFLAQGELAFTMDTEQLFVGGINGNVQIKNDGLFNAISKIYEGVKSQVVIKANPDEADLTLIKTEDNTISAPKDSMRIYRDVNSKGTTNQQVGGLILRSEVGKDCDHHEFGMFSIIHNRAEYNTENVGIYSQVTATDNSKSTIFGAVLEVKDTWQENYYPNAVNNRTLCGLEVDVCTHFKHEEAYTKLGIAIYAYGGGESGEGIRIGSGGRGNGTYMTGDFQYGIRIMNGSLNDKAIAIYLEADSSQGITFTGHTKYFGISMVGQGENGISIGNQYLVPLTITADKMIKMNGSTGNEGISYDSIKKSINLTSEALALTNHTVLTSAVAGGTQALPASVTGYIGIYVNGFLKKIPYFN